MHKWLVFSSLFIIWISLTLTGISAEELSEKPNEYIPVGERLIYKVSWLGIPMGTGELWAKEKTTLAGREVIHVVGTFETNKVLSKIFPVHDEAHSWIDTKTYESVQFEKKVNELVIKAHDIATFDAPKKRGYLESLKTGLKKEFNVTTPVQDVFSVFYWARRQDLLPGKSVKTVLTADQKDWDLEVKVHRMENVKLHGTKISTIRVEPITRVGGVEKRGRAWFNLTNDSSRKPVRIIYKAPIGRLTGILKTVESP